MKAHFLAPFCFLIALSFGLSSSATKAQESQTTSFTSCNGKLIFDYPATWFVQEIRQNVKINHVTKYGTLVRLANSEIAMRALAADLLPPDGQIMEIFIWPPLPYEPDPYESLLNTTSVFQEEFGPVKAIEINGWVAARRDSVITYQNTEIATIYVQIALPGQQELDLIAQSYSDDYFELDANVELLLANISYQALERDLEADEWDTYYEPKCTFRLAYPTAWIVSEAYSNQLIFFNSQDAQDTRRRRRDYKDDQLEIEIIQPQDLPEFFEDIGFDTTDAKPDDILMAYAEAERLSVETPIPFTVGDHEVLRADFRGGFILLYDFGEGQYSILAARSSEDGFAAFEETILQIAGSVQYNPIQEDEPSIEMTPTPTP